MVGGVIWSSVTPAQAGVCFRKRDASGTRFQLALE